MARKKTVLIIGASRGLGLALAEKYCSLDYGVVATVRTPSPGLQQLLDRFPSSLEIETADITNAESISKLGQRLEGREIDTLFVNAGICIARENTPIDVAESDFVDLMVTNALSPMRAVEILRGLVSPRGVIAVMSSELGSIQHNQGFWEIYSSSKAALNMLMKCYAARSAGDTRA